MRSSLATSTTVANLVASVRWVETRMRRVLPTHHFHVVSTLPAELHGLARRNRARCGARLERAAGGSPGTSRQHRRRDEPHDRPVVR